MSYTPFIEVFSMIECRCDAPCLLHRRLTRMLPLGRYPGNANFPLFPLFSSINICGHSLPLCLHCPLGIAAGETCGVVPHLAVLSPLDGLLHPLARPPGQFRIRLRSFSTGLPMAPLTAQLARAPARARKTAKKSDAAHCKTPLIRSRESLKKRSRNTKAYQPIRRTGTSGRAR